MNLRKERRDEQRLKIIIDFEDENCRKICQCLSAPTRLNILRVIAEEQGIFVTQIAERLNLTESNISTQTRLLLSLGFIRFELVRGSHGTCKKLYINWESRYFA